MQIQPALFEEDAKSRFGRLETRARSCVAKAEEVWNAACTAAPRMRKACRGRGRNSLFNELVADFAREEFSDDAEVDVCEQYGTVRLHFQGEFDFGFKKIDAKGRTCNYPTARRERYDRQMPLFGDPLPEAVRLHIGIQWNQAGTEVTDVYLIYPIKRSPLWMYPCRQGGFADGEPVRLPVQKSPAKVAQFRSKSARDGKAKRKAK